MALGDIIFYAENNGSGSIGDVVAQVQAASTVINAGEPVARALGQQYATPLANNKPVVGTDFIMGIASTTSTQTSTADAFVRVNPMTSKIIYLANPKVPATFATQSAYNALVGDRVLLDLTSGVYTILATDGSTNGCVIEDLDIAKYPGKVAFSFRDACNYLA